MERVLKQPETSERTSSRRTSQLLSAAVPAHDKIASLINNSPRVAAQRKHLDDIFGKAVQLQEQEPLQGRFVGWPPRAHAEVPVQRVEDEEEPLQGKFDTAQRVEDEETEEPLQGKLNPVQRAGDEEEPLIDRGEIERNDEEVKNEKGNRMSRDLGICRNFIKYHESFEGKKHRWIRKGLGAVKKFTSVSKIFDASGFSAGINTLATVTSDLVQAGQAVRILSNPEKTAVLEPLVLGGVEPAQRVEAEENEEPFQKKFDTVQAVGRSLRAHAEPAQRVEDEDKEEPLQGYFETVQRLDEEKEVSQPRLAPDSPAQLEPDSATKPNNTGLPDNLKAGIESLSGISLDNVKVHYKSSQPSQLNALAYAQGADIHVAPGQEQHLPHEAWHVVQQAQGRVKPTMQAKGRPINDDSALESEADKMGRMVTSASSGDPCFTETSYR